MSPSLPPVASALAAASPAPRRILGIDPGLRTTGYGVIVHSARKLAYVASGCIRSPSASLDLPGRIKVIIQDLREVIDSFEPTEVAIEIVFVNVNPQSTLLLGQARGAAISAAVMADLPVAEYTALQIKQAVAGHGKAAKEQVQEMVKRLLDLPSKPAADAADALACAICHAHASESFGGLRRTGFKVRGGRIL